MSFGNQAYTSWERSEGFLVWFCSSFLVSAYKMVIKQTQNDSTALGIVGHLLGEEKVRYVKGAGSGSLIVLRAIRKDDHGQGRGYIWVGTIELLPPLAFEISIILSGHTLLLDGKAIWNWFIWLTLKKIQAISYFNFLLCISYWI